MGSFLSNFQNILFLNSVANGMKMFERARPEALPACMLDSASGPESMHGRMPAFLEASLYE
jgi:hypothetical protein